MQVSASFTFSGVSLATTASMVGEGKRAALLTSALSERVRPACLQVPQLPLSYGGAARAAPPAYDFPPRGVPSCMAGFNDELLRNFHDAVRYAASSSLDIRSSLRTAPPRGAPARSC